ncbi:conserved hypothetical protein [Ricinus communis]|uniref:Uncharacterized protein n=1 Tax=Ricinus communis TaxID=3988 RepID=B9RR62_RICCO|nr:conserved hypothetical protein [Ricinus communis]
MPPSSIEEPKVARNLYASMGILRMQNIVPPLYKASSSTGVRGYQVFLQVSF